LVLVVLFQLQQLAAALVALQLFILYNPHSVAAVAALMMVHLPLMKAVTAAQAAVVQVAGAQVQLIHKTAALHRAVILLQVEKVMQQARDISQVAAVEVQQQWA
jgi:hypothetical protein